MKLLHTSDWHIGKNLFEYSLLEDQRHFLGQLAEMARAEAVDAILISGDLFDRSVPSAQAVALLDEALTQLVEELQIPVLAISGNHDSPQRLAFGSRLARRSGLYITGEITREIATHTLEDAFGPVDFYLLPYLFPGDVRPLFPEEEVRTFDQAYRALINHNAPRIAPGRRSVLLAHGFFSPIGEGADLCALTSDSEVSVGATDLVDANIFAPFTYCAFGHLHRPQTPMAGMRYPGSPLHYSLSELGRPKSVTIVTLGAEGLAEVRELPIKPLRGVQVVRGSLAELLSPTFLPDGEKGDYLFAELTDQSLVLHAMEKLSVLYPRLLGLRFLALEHQGNALPEVGGNREQLPIPLLFEQFFEAVKGEPMTGEQQSIMTEVFDELQKEGAPCGR